MGLAPIGLRPFAFARGCETPGAPFRTGKEVIQPHLPVRLPCYDFTPLTRRTLDASFPYGLSLRLRVPPTRVV